MKFAIIGLSTLGLFTATALSKYHEITLFDEEEKRISKIKNQYVHDNGDGFLDDFTLAKEKFQYASSLQEIIEKESIIFLCIDKIDSKGKLNYNWLFTLLQRIAEMASHPLTLIIRTTLPIGTIAKIKNILCEMKKDNIISIIYFPYFHVDGYHYHHFSSPSHLLVGRDEDRLHLLMMEILSPMMTADTKIYYATCKEAEIILYSYFSYRSAQMAFFDEIQAICGKEQVDIGMVLDAIPNQEIQKISANEISPSYQVELREFSHWKEQNQLPNGIVKDSYESLKKKTNSILQWISSHLSTPLANKKCAILGLSSSEDRYDLRFSFVASFIKLLLQEHVTVYAYDPNIETIFQEYYKDLSDVHYMQSVRTAIKDADFVIVLSDEKAFRKIKEQDFIIMMKKNPILFDYVGIYRNLRIRLFSYFSYYK